MPRALEYFSTDASPKRPLRRLNFVIVPSTVLLFLVFVFQAPMIAVRWHSHLPRMLMNTLYFLPQTTFPYDRMFWESAPGPARVFNDATAHALDVLQWVLVAAGLTFITRRDRLLAAVTTVIVVSLGVAVFGALLFAPFGIDVQPDGP